VEEEGLGAGGGGTLLVDDDPGGCGRFGDTELPEPGGCGEATSTTTLPVHWPESPASAGEDKDVEEAFFSPRGAAHAGQSQEEERVEGRLEEECNVAAALPATVVPPAPRAGAPATAPPDQEQSGTAAAAAKPSSRHSYLLLLVAASSAEDAAVAADRAGNVPEALRKYGECESALDSAFAAALPSHAGDQCKLLELRHEVLSRIEYLGNLDGQAPVVPVERHITAVQLQIHTAVGTNSAAAVAPLAGLQDPPLTATADRACGEVDEVVAQGGGDTAAAANGSAAVPSAEAGSSATSSVAKYAAFGLAGGAMVASGGILVVGTAMGATAASATVAYGAAVTAAAGAAGAGFCTARPEKVDCAAQRAGKTAASVVTNAATTAAIAVSASGTAAERAMGAVEDSARGLHRVGTAGAERAQMLGSGIAARLSCTGAQAFKKVGEANDAFGSRVEGAFTYGIDGAESIANRFRGGGSLLGRRVLGPTASADAAASPEQPPFVQTSPAATDTEEGRKGPSQSTAAPAKDGRVATSLPILWWPRR